MKITVIKSSPHKNGSSNMLADNFIKGAEEKGHEIYVFDAGHARIAPCIACNACGMNGPCIHKDDIPAFQEKLSESDMVVFVTPIYYFGFSSQMKIVIDRLYNINSRLTAKHLKSLLIVSSWDSNAQTLKDIASHYNTISNYLGFENLGMILGAGCGNTSMTSSTVYPQKAYETGKNL